MNKRLERVDLAKDGLRVIYHAMHDARFEGEDMVLTLENGYIFWVRGFKDKDAFEKEFDKRKSIISLVLNEKAAMEYPVIQTKDAIEQAMMQREAK